MSQQTPQTRITWSNEQRRLAELVPWPRNPRQIKRDQADRLKRSFADFGQVETIAIGPENQVYNGHQRLNVLMAEHGPDYMVDVRVASRALTEKERERLTVYLHKGAAGEWDFDLLANEFEFAELVEWGFDKKELLGLDFGDAEPADDPGAQIDRAEELREKWGVETGQLWQIGRHRLICGDCTDRAVVERLLDIQPGIMVTDPPYGVNYNPQWRSDAAADGHLAYAASRVGKVTNDDRADWREAWMLFPGDVVYSWHPAGATSLVHAAALQDSGFVLRMQIIWAKSNFPIGRGDYHVRHEPCWYAVRDGKPAQRTDDRTQTTLWQINLDKNVDGGHSTQKPLECMERPIRNHKFDVVYDPFLGSGTTLVACERLGRQGRGVEISPAYCAVALERLAGMGLEPELLG